MSALILIVTLVSLPIIGLVIGVHRGLRRGRPWDGTTPADHGLAFEEVRIPSRRDCQLVGWWLPTATARQTLVVLHGWGSNAERMLPLARPLHRSGYQLLLVDARSHGQSDTDRFATLPTFAEDLDSAITWVQSQPEGQATHIIPVGHSFGASAALLLAARRQDLAGVIALAPFAHPDQVIRPYLRQRHVPKFLLPLVLGYIQWVTGHRFEDVAPFNHVARIACPVLLLHGEADEVVPLAEIGRLVERFPPDRVQFRAVPHAGHQVGALLEGQLPAVLDFLNRL